MELYNGDCLEIMKDLSNNSIDLLFCDLPYGQTSCKWDCLIDLDLFWKQINRICKDDCPMFFTCSTKFGVSLINSNPKNFRYDLVWVKSSPCGFLNAKKMPMKKHEMVYVFYNKLPKVYGECIAEHHTHKFIKEVKDENLYIRGKETNSNNEDVYDANDRMKNGKLYHHARCKQKGDEAIYDPPLPTSVIRDGTLKTTLYSCKNKEEPRELWRNKGGQYDPPLPTSVIKYDQEHNSILYGDVKRDGHWKTTRYDPPLPTSVIGEKSQISTLKKGGINNLYGDMEGGTIGNVHGSNYDPPLPNSILEVASQKGKHATQKPVDLIKWCLKYYSKEGDVVLDPTMGSGSTGVACKDMNRQFIGVEMDEAIFNVAVERLE